MFSLKRFLILLPIITSCVSTGYKYKTVPPKILAHENILILKVQEVSSAQSHDLFIEAYDKLNTPENRVLYLPNHEFDLAVKGVSTQVLNREPLEEHTREAIIETLNVDLILEVNVIDSRNRGGSLAYYTRNELPPATYLNQDNETREAKLEFNLFDPANNVVRSRFYVTCTISALTIPEDEGGEYRINLTNDYSAIATAYAKGIKRIRKGLIKTNP